MTASPDGNIVNKTKSRRYSYPFRNGGSYHASTVYETGYVVHRDKAAGFFQAILPGLGLLPYEYKSTGRHPCEATHGGEYDGISIGTVTARSQTGIRAWRSWISGASDDLSK